MVIRFTKRCGKCGEYRPITDFGLNAAKVDGRNDYCRVHERERQRELKARKKAEYEAEVAKLGPAELALLGR